MCNPYAPYMLLEIQILKTLGSKTSRRSLKRKKIQILGKTDNIHGSGLSKDLHGL